MIKSGVLIITRIT